LTIDNDKHLNKMIDYKRCNYYTAEKKASHRSLNCEWCWIAKISERKTWLVLTSNYSTQPEQTRKREKISRVFV